ncbi:hypothetical protein CYMTET_11192 [Cymbomonas tetramitiformis]|uniref:Uncharacterized protein n=1 Tax=Cymbomonas tetramitiformis TaxID=36881 RepID=A0AAE0LDE6_9CHLO|nr:hypothetical protein CYMTET_11192 [Cymbomonas tetramitiformis]
MAAVNEATNVRSEEEVKSVYGDLQLVARMLAISNGVDKKCDAVAPALDRCVRFFEAADVQSAVEMLGFGLELVVPAIDAGLFVVLEYIPEDSDVFTSPNGVRGLRKDCGSTRWPVVLVACPVAAPKGKAWKIIGL